MVFAIGVANTHFDKFTGTLHDPRSQVERYMIQDHKRLFFRKEVILSPYNSHLTPLATIRHAATEVPSSVNFS